MDPLYSELATAVTEGIRVSVRSAYVREESSPDHEHYVFAYHVQIINESPYKVQLLRRKWEILDALGRKREVSGEGVIGQQPLLAPGQVHEYISGCNFGTPIGQMQGHYFMIRNVDQAEFPVRIPRFTMVVPFTLN